MHALMSLALSTLASVCIDPQVETVCGLVSSCIPTATSQACGNGVVEGTEECDDGNRTNQDGCTSDCANEVEWRFPMLSGWATRIPDITQLFYLSGGCVGTPHMIVSAIRPDPVDFGAFDTNMPGSVLSGGRYVSPFLRSERISDPLSTPLTYRDASSGVCLTWTGGPRVLVAVDPAPLTLYRRSGIIPSEYYVVN